LLFYYLSVFQCASFILHINYYSHFYYYHVLLLLFLLLHAFISLSYVVIFNDAYLYVSHFVSLLIFQFVLILLIFFCLMFAFFFFGGGVIVICF